MYMYLYIYIYIYLPTPAAQGGARKGRRVSKTPSLAWCCKKFQIAAIETIIQKGR